MCDIIQLYQVTVDIQLLSDISVFKTNSDKEGHSNKNKLNN